MNDKTFKLYRLTFPNNKIYIGMTYREVEDRYKDHIYFASTNRYSYILHKAIRKYGPKSIKIETLAIGHKEYISELEKSAIKIYDCQNSDFGYNIANGGPGTAFYGPHTEEAKIKIGKSSLGRKHTKETKHKMSRHLIEYDGEIRSISELSETYDIPANILTNRILLHKWDVKRALTQSWKKRNVK